MDKKLFGDLAFRTRFIFGAIIMALALAVVYARHANDPDYQGKRLSEHLATLTDFSTSPDRGMSGAYLSEPIEPRAGFAYSEQTARDAVSAVGTNALPMLIGMLGSKDSQIGLWLEEMAKVESGPKRSPRRACPTGTPCIEWCPLKGLSRVRGNSHARF